MRLLGALGVTGFGWDPTHRPGGQLRKSSVVNLGYVVNVIESPTERRDALSRAWSLAQKALIVSARLTMDARSLCESEDYSDGCLTGRGTFQKFFDQNELRNWINQTLGVLSVPAAPGIFYVFRDEQARTAFVASRYRRRLSAPRPNKSGELFREHEGLLQSLIDFVAERGRLPGDDELPNAAQICGVFGSVRRAFQVLSTVTDKERWAEVTKKRKEDLLIYLALSRFGGRPHFGRLSRTLQGDVKGLFGNHKRACDQADALLYSLGKPGVVDAYIQNSKVGKLTPTALYFHESALTNLSPILRLFEGCAQAYIGRVEDANVIKLYRNEPKVSYLSYPEFESDPHPALASSLAIHLQTFRIRARDYRNHRDVPILHRKELFICADHLLHQKFARLTRIEDAKGLYEDTRQIGTREGWDKILESKGLRLRGHRLLSGATDRSC